MSAYSANAVSLRAEAQFLSLAGMILLAVSLPGTLFLALSALSPEGLSPWLPIALGGPPLLAGYCLCHLGSRTMSKALAADTGAETH